MRHCDEVMDQKHSPAWMTKRHGAARTKEAGCASVVNSVGHKQLLPKNACSSEAAGGWRAMLSNGACQFPPLWRKEGNDVGTGVSHGLSRQARDEMNAGFRWLGDRKIEKYHCAAILSTSIA
jgi:hypothetical protein